MLIRRSADMPRWNGCLVGKCPCLEICVKFYKAVMEGAAIVSVDYGSDGRS